MRVGREGVWRSGGGNAEKRDEWGKGVLIGSGE